MDAELIRSHTVAVPRSGTDEPGAIAGDEQTATEDRTDVSSLQRRALALEQEVEHRKQLEQALREALAQRQQADLALRNSQQELLDFFENAAEGLHSADADHVILYANRAELAMLGYTREEYLGHRLEEFHVDPTRVDAIFNRLSRNETVSDFKAELRCKDGSTKHVRIQANAYFRDGQFVHTRCFTTDVSERHRLEQDLRRQNQELVRAVRFSELFVEILGHDLRNPLSAISTAASLLRRRADSEKLQKPVSRILNSTQRMGRMIDQLLDFTRIRLGKGLTLQPRGTDLADVCRAVAQEIEQVEARERFHWDIAGDGVGLWDAERLMQLLSNLLGNALAHGDVTEPVTVHVDGTHAKVVIIEVRNIGAVRSDVLPVFFEPFRSASHERHERSNGLGLGLFISRQIVEGHQGSLEVFSSERDGTRVVVRLPRIPPIVQSSPVQ